ncbi:twin-arginine translocase TatA/TatE family subunit [Thermodesulforhabdus norvegica]|uniref:Sec-independent protein translocase protein TatA n=1 Tax=Thermodesulforhabdus norvegica TaxID=39841 RepID=A0A1I4UVJ0_9BACT|nr:twin-arginine translocase TatA/TatE family subunit [Thermodesulforhabdus norvegica]SFM92800.1 sec-independent protein translocase protein TatA [Thermodesulforhabdus norvegica]
MIGGIGMPELLVILFIVLIIFGAGKLPEIGAGLGKGIRNFKKAVQEPTESITQHSDTLKSSNAESEEKAKADKVD